MVCQQADAMVLKGEERDFLEGQVRRHNTPVVVG